MSASVKSASARSLRMTALGTAASIPWCCVVPAALAAAGTVSAVAPRRVGAATPLFLAVSVGLFARSHYLLWVKRHGSRVTRLATVGLTLVSGCFWAVRLAPAAATFVLG